MAEKLPPFSSGCYGWPRACEHEDDLACTLAEEIARDPSFADLIAEVDRDWERQFPGMNRPVALAASKVGRRRRRG